MTNTLNKDDDLLILSGNNSIDFGESSTNEQKEDDFAFTIMEDENSLIEDTSSTKNELKDLFASTSENTKNDLSDLGSILGEVSENKVEEKEEEPFIISENNTEKSELLDLMSNINSEKVEENPFGIEKTEEKVSFTQETPKTSEVFIETKKEEENIKEAEETKITSISSQKIGDMSEILSETISNISKRENIIGTEISSVETDIEELEEELKEKRENLSELKIEQEALKNNRTAIEKMKNDYENPNPEPKTKKISK